MLSDCKSDKTEIVLDCKSSTTRAMGIMKRLGLGAMGSLGALIIILNF